MFWGHLVEFLTHDRLLFIHWDIFLGQEIWVSLLMIVPNRTYICNPQSSWDDRQGKDNNCYPVRIFASWCCYIIMTWIQMLITTRKNLETWSESSDLSNLNLLTCALGITLSALPTLQNFMRIKYNSGKLESALQIYITFNNISETIKVSYKILHYLILNLKCPFL